MAILDVDELDKVIDSIREDGVFMIYHADHCRSVTNMRHYQHEYIKICDVPDLDMLKAASIRIGAEHITKIVADWFEHARATGKQSWSYNELGEYVACKLLASD